MKVVWKFSIPIVDRFPLLLPVGAQVLHVAAQNKVGCLWVLVDPSQASEHRQFRLYGTGHDIHQDGIYLGSFFLEGGDLVFHLFEETERV